LNLYIEHVEQMTHSSNWTITIGH